MNEEILKFLKDKKLVTVATIDENGAPWIANLYFGIDDDLNMYFMSKRSAKHSQHIERDSKIAYTVAWYNLEDSEDRIAIQATGTCELVTDLKAMAIGAKCIFEKFADWNINPKEALEKITTSGMYVIKPKYIKVWNDKLLGKKQEEITF